MKKIIFKTVFITVLSVALAGCTFIFQKGRSSDLEKIENLSKELDELAQTQKLLEERLAQEIKDKQVKLQMMERGLVITFVADILFDSGKAKIKPEAYQTLDKVSKVLNENVPNLNIGIEGHTDNQPIQFSGWKSNWELSTARALSILHFIVDEKGVAPERVAAIGYGEHHPVATNDTKEGRQANRRVEIVILPPSTKVKGTQETETSEVQETTEQKISEPAENLK